MVDLYAQKVGKLVIFMERETGSSFLGIDGKLTCGWNNTEDGEGRWL